MLQLPSLESATKTIISLVAGKVIERAKRTEWYVKIIQKMGLDPNNIPSDFNGLYLYTLVAYGMKKNEATLNLFRENLVKDVFRASFEKNDQNLFVKTVGEFLNSEDGKAIGFPESELRYEYEGFKGTFEILSNQSKNVHEIQNDKKIEQINNQVGYFLDELTKLKKEQSEQIFSLERKLDSVPFEIKLQESKSAYEEMRKDVGKIRGELQETLKELRPQIVKHLAKQDVLEFDKGFEEIIEILNRLESGFIWVTFFGNTNAGKSSIANSLMGEDVAEVGIEIDLTGQPFYYEKSPWKLVDVPGILGKEVNKTIAVQESKKAHGLVFVITGEPYGPELELFELVHNAVPETPVIVFFNKEDEFKNTKTTKEQEIVRSKVKEKMRKFVKSDDDIVYGSAQLKKLDEKVRQPLPQLLDRMYADMGTFGQVIQIIDPADRAVNISSKMQERLFNIKSAVARKLIRYFGWASIIGNVVPFDELFITPGILATMTYFVSNIMGIKRTREETNKMVSELLNICAAEIGISFTIVGIASILSNLLVVGIVTDVLLLSSFKYNRTVTFGEVLLEYIRTGGRWEDGDRHKAVLACKKRAEELYGSLKPSKG